MPDNPLSLGTTNRNRTPLKKILVIRQRGIGDIVLSTPVLRSIRAHFRDSWITLVVDFPYGGIFRADPAIDEIIELRKTPMALLRSMEKIRGRYHIAFDLISTPFSLFLSLLSGARVRIGWAKPGRKRALFYTHPVDISRSIPSIEANLRALAPLHIPPVTHEVGLSLTEEERKTAKEHHWRELSLDINRLTIALHPGSLFETKQWFPERFAALADLLQGRDCQVVITGSYEESATVEEVVEASRTKPRVLPPTSLTEFIRFIASVDMVITNDSGVMHLAQAVGTKTCAIFGSTDPFIWFPYKQGERGDFLYSGRECSPCGMKRCDSLKCLKDITVVDVLNKAVEVMGIPKAGG